MGSNTEKEPWTNLQKSYKIWSNEIKSDNVCYRKVGRAITKSEAIEKNSILMVAIIVSPTVVYSRYKFVIKIRTKVVHKNISQGFKILSFWESFE